MIYCCLEHVDVALDMTVDEHEVAPVLEEIEDKSLSTGCEFCQKPAAYLVKN